MSAVTEIHQHSLKGDESEAWYRQMVLIRRFEEHIQALFSKGLVRGTTHLAIGQEAVAVGASAGLHRDDWTLATYRGHHHALARGMSPTSAFAEILGRTAGCCEGKGGSMHLTDVTTGLLGCYAIVGAHLPIAVGCAWSSKLRNEDRVTACFFGDGTTTIGAFHEAVNLAAVWKLPILFVCENNLYSEYTPIADVVPVDNPAADRASAYGLERQVVDGNDVSAVAQAVAQARQRAAEGGGPAIIEALTYRHGGHSRADPAKYRPQEEVEAWMARDPIARLGEHLTEQGTDLAALHASVEQQLGTALEEALASPEPEPEALLTHVWGNLPAWQL